VEELVDLPFGHRRYTCRDPQGHEWSFAQALENRSSGLTTLPERYS
jgi:uncharacterized glyoxalase superfamily protein PhnB